jgi:hypothetical protein
VTKRTPRPASRRLKPSASFQPNDSSKIAAARSTAAPSPPASTTAAIQRMMFFRFMAPPSPSTSDSVVRNCANVCPGSGMNLGKEEAELKAVA